MKTIVSKFILLLVFNIVLQSCTADALPEDLVASPEKKVVKSTNVSADDIGDPIIPIRR